LSIVISDYVFERIGPPEVLAWHIPQQVTTSGPCCRKPFHSTHGTVAHILDSKVYPLIVFENIDSGRWKTRGVGGKCNVNVIRLGRNGQKGSPLQGFE
jgi:hypothetical protein